MKNGSVTLYCELEEILKQRIKNGELKVGDQIPTVSKPSKELGICRRKGDPCRVAYDVGFCQRILAPMAWDLAGYRSSVD